MPACRQVPSLNDGATRSTRAKDNVLAWYLLYSKPRQEGVAVENLKRQGYETYLPLIRTRRRRQGQYVSLVEPMFPRYLFIHLSDQTDNWGPIRSTLGVSGLVRFGDLPAQVPGRLRGDLPGPVRQGTGGGAPRRRRPGDAGADAGGADRGGGVRAR